MSHTNHLMTMVTHTWFKSIDNWCVSQPWPHSPWLVSQYEHKPEQNNNNVLSFPFVRIKELKYRCGSLYCHRSTIILLRGSPAHVLFPNCWVVAFCKMAQCRILILKLLVYLLTLDVSPGHSLQHPLTPLLKYRKKKRHPHCIYDEWIQANRQTPGFNVYS